MLIRDYYLKALQHDMYKKKVWVIEIFSKCDFTIFEEVEEHTLYDYQLVKRKNDNKSIYFISWKRNEFGANNKVYDNKFGIDFIINYWG